MISRERGLELHGRSCRDEILTDAERAELDAWYAAEDADEIRELDLTEQSPSLSELRAELDHEVGRLQRTLLETQEIESRNEALRQEIATLKRRLAEREPALIP